MPTFSIMISENIKFIGENKNHIMFDLKQKGFIIKNAVWFGSGNTLRSSMKICFMILYIN